MAPAKKKTVKKVSKVKMKMTKAGAALKRLYNSGVRKVTLYYTREVNGKKVPNYKTIGLTAALVTAAGAGAYAYRRHKKHGHIIQKKKK